MYVRDSFNHLNSILLFLTLKFNFWGPNYVWILSLRNCYAHESTNYKLQYNGIILKVIVEKLPFLHGYLYLEHWMKDLNTKLCSWVLASTNGTAIKSISNKTNMYFFLELTFFRTLSQNTHCYLYLQTTI